MGDFVQIKKMYRSPIDFGFYCIEGRVSTLLLLYNNIRNNVCQIKSKLT